MPEQLKLRKMETLTLTLSDINYIKANSSKEVDTDGSIVLRLSKFYRFNDATIMISSICGKPYNEIEIHGRLTLNSIGDISGKYSSCIAEANDELFSALIRSHSDIINQI